VPPLDPLRARLRADPALAVLALLVLGNVALVWSLPVIVGQDLPQHLSYARILADFGDPRLPFRDTFTLPARPQPYFTAYLLLAPLTRLTSVLTACRVLYTAYVVAVAAGFSSLVRAVHAPTADDAPPQGAERTPWTCLFGAVLPWNPVQCVGFLPFMLSLPAVLFAAAGVVRATTRWSRKAGALIVAASAAAASLHFVAAGCVVAFAGLHALFRPSRRGLLAAALTVVATLGTIGVWHAVGDRGLDPLPYDDLAASVASLGLLDGVVRTLGVQWNGLDAKVGFVVATVLGPLPRAAKLGVGLAILGLVAVAVSARKQAPARASTGPEPRAYGLTALGFLALVVATPTAVRVPDDICLLDFRLYVVAFMLAVAWVSPRAFEPRRARVAVTVFVTALTVMWGRQLHGAAREARTVVSLVERLDPKESLLALPFHDRSEFLDEDNSVTHYFPVYYTALRGGVTSLFWGKYSHHLPVGYQAGREPVRPPDWDPSKFTRAELLAASHVLVEWPDPDDGDAPATGATRLRGELASGFTAEGCDGRWCLYRSPAGGQERRVTEGEEARR